MVQLSLPFNIASPLAITSLSFWAQLKRYIKNYAAQQNRFEIEPQIPPALLALALKSKVRCVHCNKWIHPVRLRKASPGRNTRNTAKQFFVALTCPLKVNMGCARGKRARDASAALAQALR
jgi:hypothetical protein